MLIEVASIELRPVGVRLARPTPLRRYGLQASVCANFASSSSIQFKVQSQVRLLIQPLRSHPLSLFPSSFFLIIGQNAQEVNSALSASTSASACSFRCLVTDSIGIQWSRPDSSNLSVRTANCHSTRFPASKEFFYSSSGCQISKYKCSRREDPSSHWCCCRR